MTQQVAQPTKLATAVVQDYAARQHVDTTRQLARRMRSMRPQLRTQQFRVQRPQPPTVARMPALQSGSSRLGQAIKASIQG